MLLHELMTQMMIPRTAKGGFEGRTKMSKNIFILDNFKPTDA